MVPPSNKHERSFKSLAEEEMKEAAGEALGQAQFDVSLYEPSQEILAVFTPLMQELSLKHAKLSEEVRSKYMDDFVQEMADPAHRQKNLVEVLALFDQCDADKDG